MVYHMAKFVLIIILVASAGAQTSGTAAAAGYFGPPNQHVGFDRPEAWALKYFASTTLLSGLTPPEPAEGRRPGSITLGLELDWIPELDLGQRTVGFNGTKPEDLNKAPILARPVV